VSCAMLENGLATPEEIIDACSKCFLDEDKPCREERELIEQSHTLLLGGLAALTLAVPFFRYARALTAAFRPAFGAIGTALQRAGFGFTVRTDAAAATGFEAAQAGLTPEYLAAVSKSASILSRLQVAARATTATQGLLALAGLTASVTQFIFPAAESPPDA